MRIAFDGTTLRPGRTGVGYYTEHLLRHLAKREPDGGITVVSNRAVDTTEPLPSNMKVAVSPWNLPRMVWMQTQAPRLVSAIGAQVAHFTNGMVPLVSSVPSVVTIHDMSLTMYPRTHPARRVLLNRPMVDLAARRAAAIITVSQSAKADIVRLYRLDPDRVHVVHEAAAPEFKPLVDIRALDRVRTRYQLADRFILHVGTIEPRKNLVRLIEAFAERRRRGALSHQLVCVGPYGWLSRDIEALIERLQVADAIRFTGYVPFEDLPAIYNLAEMLVFPSIYEGFGLPVIEAMACGTPVLTGRLAVADEVGGQAVEQVQHLDPFALGVAMVRLSEDSARRNALRTAGLERARTFSWDRAAQETLSVYASALANARVSARVSAPLQSRPR